jgi:cyclopropane fatty-acyl-phospholipid synthase-like methyltransferase
MTVIQSRRRTLGKELIHPSSNLYNGFKEIGFWKLFSKRVGLFILLICLWVTIYVASSPIPIHGGQGDSEDFGLDQSQDISSSVDVPKETEVLGKIHHDRCSLSHYSFNNVGKGGSWKPILIKGWKNPKNWTETKFLSKVGNYRQYLKDHLVQPIKDRNGQLCQLPGSEIAMLMKSSLDKSILFFTNNKENEEFMRRLESDYIVPKILQHINSFQVLSIVPKSKSHSFHKHGETWLGQVEGRRMWWFLPPSAEKTPRVNACNYMDGTENPPNEAISCVQEPGDVIWFPADWYHATCAMDDWTVGIGAQNGPLTVPQFSAIDQGKIMTHKDIVKTKHECLGMTLPKLDKVQDSQNNWSWFHGDLNAYYNHLEKDHTRNPKKIATYAVHRWMGDKRSTEEHYRLLDAAVSKHHKKYNSTLHVFDAGCGLGSGLMWMEKYHPNWVLTGNTISEGQQAFINSKLPKHKFHVNLQSYNDLEKNYDFIYSIEALIHSPNITETFQEWSSHLNEEGVIAIIDDFLADGVAPDEIDIIHFRKSWLANSFTTTKEFEAICRRFGLELVEMRDLILEFQIKELNYKNKIPDIRPKYGLTHQGWMGSKLRQKLTVTGKISYNLLVFQKKSTSISRKLSDIKLPFKSSVSSCSSVPSKDIDSEAASFPEITSQLMSGQGKNGGSKLDCISSWYCCNKGHEWYDTMEANRTDKTSYLKLPRGIFGHYITSFAKHLNDHYKSYPSNAGGKFLDIGGTGSTASGMKQVVSKFQHFAGPLEYWILDSDSGAKELERTLHCDIDDCVAAETCGFDVTFSHTVLEHARRPWKSFDTIARITKRGGLTMHLVPFSYQYHATPGDNYRFSHTALISLLEDRNFTVLESGYDICTKPEKMQSRYDEHFDVIWLTYIIGKKN